MDNRVCILENGEEIAISNLIDSSGDETDNIEDAVVLVAGPTADELWFCVDLADLYPRVLS